MTEGRIVYVQEHDTKYGGIPSKLSSAQGVWSFTEGGRVYLRAATPSESPTSAKWQYDEDYEQTWRDDPALTVTGLSEKPTRECEVTIRLSQGGWLIPPGQARAATLGVALHTLCAGAGAGTEG